MNKLILSATFLVLIVFLLFFGIYTEIANGSLQTQASDTYDLTPMMPYLIGVFVAVLAIWVFVKSPPLVKVLLLGIVLFSIAVTIFYAGDKNNDGQADVMTIRAVQPTGNNPGADLIYSDVNQNNSVANVVNAFGFTVYLFGFIAMVLVSLFVGMFVIKNKS